MARINANSPERLVRQANRWRDGYNPLRGLIMTRVVALLEAGERGEFADLQWLYRFVERRYPVLRSLVARRRAAISKLSWSIQVNKGIGSGGKAEAADPETVRLLDLAERQRAFLEEKYNKIRNLNRAIRQLALAEFRGFAICQKHRDAAGDTIELHWLPQWNWVRDGIFGDWFWNPTAQAAGALAMREEYRIRTDGEGLARSEFVIREVEAPINEIGVVAYLRTNLSQKDWDAFIELFGLPGCVVVMPPNIPPGKEGEYETAAEAVAEGSSGALPHGADAKFPTGAIRASGVPFKEHLEWQEKDVVLAGTGGKLTMLTGPVGLGGGQSEVHEDVFDELATAEAGEISEVFHDDFDRPLLEAAFPGQPVLARFCLEPVDKSAEQTKAFKREVYKAFMADGTVGDILANQTDLKQLTTDVDLPVNEEYVDPYVPVLDQGGQPVTGEVSTDAEGDIIGALVTPRTESAYSAFGGPVRNRAETERWTTETGLELARAMAADLAPVRERLERILEIEDPDILKARLEVFRRELARLEVDVMADPEAARVLERVVGSGVAAGLGSET